MTTKADFTKETSLTTGILFYELQGAAIGFRTFISAVGSGETIRYSVTDGIDWEVSEGVISSGATDTLSRDTILSSSNSGNAVNWGEGEKTVSLVLTSNDINEFLTSNNNLLDVADAAAARTNLGIDISSFVTKSNNLSDLDSASTALSNLGIANHDNITVDGSGNVTVNEMLNVISSSGFSNIEVGGPSGAYIDLKAPASDDYDGRIITSGSGLNITTNPGGGAVSLQHQNATKLATTSTGVDVTGNVDATNPNATITSNAEFSAQNVDTTLRLTAYSTTNSSRAGQAWLNVNEGSRNLVLGTGNTERMRIDSSGNVGIGTSSPGARLQVDTATNNDGISITNTSTATNTSKQARLLFKGTDTVGTRKDAGSITSVPENPNYVNASMAFSTRSSDTLTERVRIDDSGNVGIGTSSPDAKLDVEGYVKIGPSSTTDQYQGISLVNGKDSSVAATSSFIDFKNNLNVADSSIITDHYTDGSSQVIIGATPAGSRTTDRRINVLHVNSSGITSSGNVTAYSDLRIKDNIEPIANALNKVDLLNGYTFDRTDIDTPRQTGVIAQEVRAVLPEAVTETDDGTLTVAYGNMMGLMIEAIKELKAEIDELKGAK